MDNMLIPFIMLLILTIALILERKFQEDKIHEVYEKKLETWKEHSNPSNKEKIQKELVALVYLEDYKLNIEILDKKAEDALVRKSYSLSYIKGIKNENN